MLSKERAYRSSEYGAIDLASIMTGLAILGLVAGVVAATVFVIIPWSQDQAAKNQVMQIATAQESYAQGNKPTQDSLVGSLVKTATPAEVKNYATLGELIDENFLPSLKKDAPIAAGAVISANEGTVCSSRVDPALYDDARQYEIAVESSTGKVYYKTDVMNAPEEAPAGERYCLGFT